MLSLLKSIAYLLVGNSYYYTPFGYIVYKLRYALLLSLLPIVFLSPSNLGSSY